LARNPDLLFRLPQMFHTPSPLGLAADITKVRACLELDLFTETRLVVHPSTTVESTTAVDKENCWGVHGLMDEEACLFPVILLT
jgi:hypothetical protein